MKLFGTHGQPEADPRASAGRPADAKELLSPTVFKTAVTVLLVYFGVRLVFYALSLSSFVPPDEVTHAQVCKVFSQVWLMPHNSPETWEYGPVTNIPWLYYWVMGKLLHLNVFGISSLVFLRLANMPLAFVTVWYLDRLLRLITQDRLARLLLLVVATNLSMFTLLSASVSYDNLTNLLAAMAIYYELAFFRGRSGNRLLASWLCQLLGSLTKITFLPLILALNVILFVMELKNLPRLIPGVRDSFRNYWRSATALTLGILVALVLNLQLYAMNYQRFGTLAPNMEMITSRSAAMNYRTEARGMIFTQFKEGKISYMDALMLAGEIKHQGDKADTFYLLMNWQKMKNNPSLWMGPAAYARFWLQTMIGTVVGIKAHLGMFKSQAYLAPVYLLAILGVAGFLLRWRPARWGWGPPALAAIALFYAGFLMCRVNWDSYQSYGEPGVTVYGRYLFPILAPVLALWSCYLLELFRSPRLRAAVAVVAAVIFIAYDFPWFLAHSNSEWFNWLPR